jgi:hypothetical protein
MWMIQQKQQMLVWQVVTYFKTLPKERFGSRNALQTVNGGSCPRQALLHPVNARFQYVKEDIWLFANSMPAPTMTTA